MNLPKTLSGTRFTSSTDFNNRISLQNPASGTDSHGQALPPVTFATNVPAKISAFINAGRPEVTQQETNNVNYYFVNIRYDARVNNNTVILSPTGQVWQITSLQDVDYYQVEMRLTVREQNSGIVS